MAIPPLRNLIIGYAITIMVVVLILLYTFTTLIKQEEALKKIDESRSAMQVLGPSLVALQEMESGLYNYISAAEGHDSSFYSQWLTRYQSDSAYFYKLASGNTQEEGIQYKELLNILTQAKDSAAKAISLFRLQQTEAGSPAIRRNKLTGIVRHYKSTISRLEDYNRKIIGTSYTQTINQTRKTFGFVKTIGIILIIILILSFFTNYRENKKKQLAEKQLKIFTDNLEKKVGEKTAEVRKNEEKLKLIYNNTNDIIFLVNCKGEDEYYFDSVNKAFLTATGLTEEQVTGKNIKDVLPEAAVKMGLENYRHIVASGKTYSWEQVSEKPSGNKVGIITITPVKNEADGCTMLVGVAHDITERKKAEQALIDAEAKFRNLVEQSLVGVYIIDNGNFSYVNPRFAKIFGYTQDELIGNSPLTIIKDGDKAMVAENVRARVAGEKESVHYEAEGLNRSGEPVYIEVFCSGKLYESSSAIIGTILDVTERKKAETEISKANERFSLIAKATNDVVWDWDMVNDVNWGNDAFYRYYGLEPGQASTNAVFTSRVHPDDLGRILSKLEKCIANREEQIVDEFRFRIPDGTYRTFYDRAYLIYDEAGKPKRMLGSMIDISEIKEAVAEKEKANYLLNERIKELTTLYQCGQVLQDDKSPVENVLQQIVTIIPGGWQYKEAAAARISIGEIEVSSSGFSQSLQKQTALFETPDHKTGIVEVIYIEQKPEADEGPFLKEERDLIDMLANMLKIYLTRRQETEALKKSEANLHTIFNTTDTMYALFDKDFKLISTNQRMIDFAKKEFNATTDENGNLLFQLPEDKQALFVKNLSSGLQGEHINYETSYPQPDGSDNWYYVRVIPVTNPEKEVLGLMVAISDITATKRMEKEMVDRQVQEQKKITRAVLKAEENARNKIGQELHDNVNQILAGTKLYLSMAEKTESNQNAVQNSIRLIDRAIEEIRGLSKSHVTPVKQVNLEQLIFSLMDKYNETSAVKTRVVYDIKTEIIEDDLKLNIYRIVQEQMNNILKHAKATTAWITLKENNDSLFIDIEDNGVGFDTSQQRSGIGISNMINRVQSFNGELMIESSKGQGTKLKIKIPL